MQTLQDKIDNSDIDYENASDHMAAFTQFMQQTACETLPQLKARSHRPWISDRTLRYIDERQEAKMALDRNLELQKHKLVKASVKQDRTSWLQQLLKSGSWQEIKKLHKPPAVK